MPLPDSLKKGNDLEEAVHVIEATILKNNPATKDAVITIEPKKIVVIDGVKSEIDIFITIDFGKGYKSIFIFECKNWEESVGKNEIIVFANKIDAVQAQKGYFIAKSFGKYAAPQAKQFKRMELLKASTTLNTLPPIVANFHIVQDKLLPPHITFRVVTNDPNQIDNIAISKDSKVRFKGEELTLDAFSEHMQRSIENEVMSHEQTSTFGDDVYQYDRTQTFTFQAEELIVDGYQCYEVEAHVAWETRVIRPRIISKFDIETRGKVIILESAALEGGRIQASFIATI